MATPLVSGALAMIMERFPNLTSAQCVDRLFQTAAGGIGSDISGRITTAFANPNEIFTQRNNHGLWCDVYTKRIFDATNRSIARRCH